MKVTVCQLRNDALSFAEDWAKLREHVGHHGSELVLLPEMPFFPWLAREERADRGLWLEAVQAHESWLKRLCELAPAVVVGTRPVLRDGSSLNEGFVCEGTAGYVAVHDKYYLPNEAGFWEANWYQRGAKNFRTFTAGQARAGMLICTEMWYTEHARFYARSGAHLLLCPRATEMSTADKWVAGGRAAAVMSGAFCLSSNRGCVDRHGTYWGGHGWIIDPDGQVLALTSEAEPFVTRELDLAEAERAKQTYPRYVRE